MDRPGLPILDVAHLLWVAPWQPAVLVAMVMLVVPQPHPHPLGLRLLPSCWGPESFWPALVTHRKPNASYVCSLSSTGENDLLPSASGLFSCLVPTCSGGGSVSEFVQEGEIGPQSERSLFLPLLL